MQRRSFLRSSGAVAATVAVAGCSGAFETGSIGNPPVVDNRPDGIYIPSHIEGMEMSGMTTQGDYKFGLMYSYAHRFWNVTGDSVNRTAIAEDDDVHLMASVWDPDTKTVLPDTGLSVAIYQDDSLVSQETIYPMLSQPMGFHYGANFGLDGDGEYTVELSVGAMATRRTNSFRDRFAEPVTAEIPFEYSEQAKSEISYERMGDRAGERGAVEPMKMGMMPLSIAPAESDLPGTVRGTTMSNDARLVATSLDSPPAGVDGDGEYLAVSARTRYNRTVLPAMGLAGTLSRDGETIYDGGLTPTLDPDLDYHYGAVVDSIASGDELTLRPTVQPQTARHEGYETAFGGVKGAMSPTTISIE